MNFCKKNDRYISLYIDEVLDDKSKKNFLKHLEACNECSNKLKEMSYFAQLCREDQDMELPESFESSLHVKLLEVSPEKNTNKFSVLVYNKRLIASLSTAAILVISLLAYSLLPHMSTRNEAASIPNDMAQVQESSAIGSYAGGSEDKSSMTAKDAGESSSKDDALPSISEDSKVTSGDAEITLTFSKPLQAENYKTAQPSNATDNQVKVEASSSKKVTSDTIDETALSIIKVEDQPDANNQQYYMNYSELNLRVSPEGVEIEALRKFMIGLCAIEPKTDIIKSMSTIPEHNTISAVVAPPQYKDYYLPLSIYSTLENQAIINKLSLTTKTGIIKYHITDKYNELNRQKIDIDKKIEEVHTRGEDTSAYEAEKTRITDEINKIITEKDMITVRVFFIL